MKNYKKDDSIVHNDKPGKVLEIIGNKIYILLNEPKNKALYPQSRWILEEDYLDVLVKVGALEVIITGGNKK